MAFFVINQCFLTFFILQHVGMFHVHDGAPITVKLPGKKWQKYQLKYGNLIVFLLEMYLDCYVNLGDHIGKMWLAGLNRESINQKLDTPG